MRFELKSISIWSVVKVAFIFNLVVGLLYGLFGAVFMGSIVSLMSGSGLVTMDEFSEADYSVGALIIIMPLFSAACAVFFGTICAVVMGVLYNLTAGVLGGLEFDFQPSGESDLSLVSSAEAPAPAPASQTQSLPSPPPPPPPPLSGIVTAPLPPDAPTPTKTEMPAADDSAHTDESEPPPTV